jgi:hypothetical protein
MNQALNVDKRWYHVDGKSHTLDIPKDQRDFDSLSEHFKIIPECEWNTCEEIPLDVSMVAILTADGHIHFSSVIDERNNTRCKFYQVKNFIAFNWGRAAVGWLPLGG